MFVLLLSILLLPQASWAMKSVPFAIPSADRQTVLTGEIDFPDTEFGEPLPAIILVGGTGLFDRDYYFGNSGTEVDFLFRDLAKKATGNGFAVVRFDYRGVLCNQRTAPACPSCKTDLEVRQNYAQHCIDNKVRETVTPNSIRDDIVSIYNFVLKDPAVDSRRVILLAHSEGTVHASYLVHEKRIQPRGLLYVGAVGDSPKSLIQWQATDIHGKIATLLWWPMDSNKDRSISNGEVSSSCRLMGIPETACATLLSPVGQWTEDSLKYRLEQEYQVALRDALAQADQAPFYSENTDLGVVFASYAWWKMFFVDTTDVASLLRNYSGKVSISNGEIDISTPGNRELPFFEKLNRGEQVRINLLKGKGHSLGPHKQVGPIPEESFQHLMTEAHWILDSNN
ncbi:hypothetical protein ACLVWU_06285 [Bdellovibrio sp. HCB290]|uniref:hypothetical protein n=1 Tax=Bdellovibrio sp. HCB290 TaxID=3394356 RepID=UPI0039B5AA70